MTDESEPIFEIETENEIEGGEQMTKKKRIKTGGG